VRRVVLAFLLALVLAPSIVTAAHYQCAYDRAIRSACCCPAAKHRDAAAERTPAVRAACCCTVLQGATGAQSAWANPTPLERHAVIAPVAMTIVAVSTPAIARAVTARPRAQGDPPRCLFARHCALLL